MAVVGQAGASFQIAWDTQINTVRIIRSSDDPSTELADLPVTTLSYIDVVPSAVVGDVLEWTVVDLVTSALDIVSYTVRDDGEAYTYGKVDLLVSAIRYADLERVKARLGITDTAYDADITQAVIACETAMDLYWGRSLPDTGINPQWPGVPVQVSQAAENLAVAVWKQVDAPFGQAGGDVFGTIDFDDEARRIITRSPMLRGLRVTYGVA